MHDISAVRDRSGGCGRESGQDREPRQQDLSGYHRRRDITRLHHLLEDTGKLVVVPRFARQLVEGVIEPGQADNVQGRLAHEVRHLYDGLVSFRLDVVLFGIGEHTVHSIRELRAIISGCKCQGVRILPV